MPTRRAALLLLVAAPLLALTTWLPLLRWAVPIYAALAAAALLVDWLLAGRALPLTVERQHDDKLSLGADNSVAITLRARAARPLTFWLRDEPPDDWVRGLTLLRAELLPGTEWRGQYTVHPLRRGDYRFGDLTARWPGPLGLMLRQRRIPLGRGVKVYPNLLDVRRYDLLLRRNRLQELGLRHSRRLGEGTEYERLRDYLPDDDYRRIHWKATARRRKPITVQHQIERSQTIMAVLDVGRMMQSPVANMAKLDYVVNAVLLLGYVAGGMGDKVGLLTFADDVQHYLAPRQGRGQFYRMLELLYSVEAQPVEPDYGRCLAWLGRKQRKRALVILFTDLLGGASLDGLAAATALTARHSLPLVVTISDPDVTAEAQQIPHDSATTYRRMAAAALLDERRLALETLSRRGVLTLDVPANQLSPAVIQRYLDIKRQTRL